MIPSLTLKPSGQKMPVFGLGTWRMDRDKCFEMISSAIDIGYRHFDCAAIYQNEDVIGEAFKKVFESGKVKREDLFITSKLWCTNWNVVEESCKATLEDLGLDYLDLYLVHWPICMKYMGNPSMRKCGKMFEQDEKNGRIVYGKTSVYEMWRGMESLVEKGLVKNIGVSNFHTPMIQNILCFCKIQPSVHQYESHPFYQRSSMDKEMKTDNIVVTAYSSLGSAEGFKQFSANEDIQKIAKKYQKTPAQVILRWAIEREQVIIPKASSVERLKENFDIFNFKLSEEDMKIIGKLEQDKSIHKPTLIGWWKIDPFI